MVNQDVSNSVRRFVHSSGFNHFILWIIVLNAVLIGVETYVHRPILSLLERLCVAIFVAEIGLKFRYSDSKRAWLRDGWNWFDIIVVGSALIPNVSQAVSVLRILRVLRVMRLVKGIPELRMIVSVLARSITSMTYIGLLMLIVFYVYAVAGVVFFGQHQPEFSTLHETFFSLFRLLTADDWSDLRQASLSYANWWLVTIYYCSWIILSTFLLINLMVGAIINNYQEVQQIELHRHLADDDRRIMELSAELNRLLRNRLLNREKSSL